MIDTLNMGISASTGEWIARMDADDISYPTRFAEQLKFIQDDIAVIGVKPVSLMNLTRYMEKHGLTVKMIKSEKVKAI